MTSKTTRLLFSAALLVSAVTVRGGTISVFNMPPGETSLQLVTVGDPGNVADPDTGYGAVSYVYQMDKYDVTIGQYTAFLNSVATTSDPYGLYNANMALATHPTTDSFSTLGIARSGSSGSYTYSVAGSYSQAANCPIFNVTWGDAARFVNWLANGQPTGPEGPGTTESGTYTLSGATTSAGLMLATRNPGSTWVLPTVDEFYKAAYYVGGGTNAGYWTYPTQSNTPPSNLLSATGTNNANFSAENTGPPSYGYTDFVNLLTPVGAFAASPGPYGTYDQGGDVWQWNETAVDGLYRGLRGGSWADVSAYLENSSPDGTPNPTLVNISVGFRVAYVPEPSSLALLLAGAVALGIWRQRRNAWRS